MDHAARVRRRQPARQLRREPLRLRGGKRSVGQQRAQRVPFEELGDQERHARFLAQVVHREHVGVLERARAARLLLEAAHAVGVHRELRGQQFERHLSPQPRVLCEIDFAHPADAQHGHDPVRADGLPCR